MLKRHPHTPAHLFVDDTPYFITSSTYDKRHLLAEPDLKTQLLEMIKTNFQSFNWQLDHWVILDNHYHLLGVSRKGTDLPKIIGRTHYHSAELIGATTHCELPVWWNYWDYCPRNERDYLIRLNYLLMNPIKHGYVNNLHDYPFSSFHQLLENEERETLVGQFHDYPEHKDLKIAEDEF